MADALIAFPNHVVEGFTPTFSGGTWSSTFPLSGMTSLGSGSSKVRSTTNTEASTQFVIDFGTLVDIRCVALVNTNLTKQAKFRVVLLDLSSVTLLDSGWMQAFPPMTDFNSLYWGHPSLWDGLPDNYQFLTMTRNALYTCTPTNASKVQIFISDVSNPDGYVQFAGTFVGGGWTPSTNISWGSKLVYEDSSVIQTAYGGAEFASKRVKRRVVELGISGIGDDEGSGWFNLLMIALGNTGQAYFVWDPADPQRYVSHSFLCRIREASPLESAAFNSSAQGYKLSEVMS